MISIELNNKYVMVHPKSFSSSLAHIGDVLTRPAPPSSLLQRRGVDERNIQA